MTIAQHVAQYLKESRSELLKVKWPTREETIRLTLAVIGVSVGLAAFLGIMDYIFNILLEQLLKLV